MAFVSISMLLASNPSVSLTADSSLYTREPWALPRQYELEKSSL